MKTTMLKTLGLLLCATVPFATAAQIGIPAHCFCVQGATYTDDPATTEPPCLQSFGVTWTPSQAGICNDPNCPAVERPCKGFATATMVTNPGICPVGILVGSNLALGPGGVLTVTMPYKFDCGAGWTFEWYAPFPQRHLGTTRFECEEC